MTRFSSVIWISPSRTGTLGRRSCTGGRPKTPSESIPTNSCKQCFQRHSRTFRPSCLVPGAGRASSSARQPKAPQWWSPLDTLCAETSNDITQRKRRQKEIENLNLELAKRSTEIEAINKELEAFAYSVSHDLRAPLRHIAG